MSDLLVVAEAIATQFVGVTADGKTLTTKTATAMYPNSINKGPLLLVGLPIGALAIGPMRQRLDEYDFPVRLLTDPLNYPDRTRALYRWANAMRDRVEMNLDLGLSYVAFAKASRIRLALDAAEYAGTTYDLVELTVHVKLFEVIPTVSV